MQIKHIVNLVVELDEKETPLHYLEMMKQMSEQEIQDMLESTFIGACNNAGLLPQLNKNNRFATIKWGK